MFDALKGIAPTFSMHSWLWPQHFRCTHEYGPKFFDALCLDECIDFGSFHFGVSIFKLFHF
jgi:hypothetical protein